MLPCQLKLRQALGLQGRTRCRRSPCWSRRGVDTAVWRPVVRVLQRDGGMSEDGMRDV